MEPIGALLFIGTVIAGVTQLVKLLAPNVNGAATIIVSVIVGVVVSLVDSSIGVVDISLAEGIMAGFGTSGAVAVAEKINTPTATNYNGRVG